MPFKILSPYKENEEPTVDADAKIATASSATVAAVAAALTNPNNALSGLVVAGSKSLINIKQGDSSLQQLQQQSRGGATEDTSRFVPSSKSNDEIKNHVDKKKFKSYLKKKFNDE